MRAPAGSSDLRVHHALGALGKNTFLSLGDLARAAGLSETHLARLIKKDLGVPLRSWKRQRALTKAMALLETTDLPIKKIQFECGCRNASNFCNAFHKYTGISPRQYREVLRKRAPR